MQIFQHLMRSHSFKSKLPPCRGVRRQRHGVLLKRVCLFASYMNRSGQGVYYECVCGSDRCLALYSGLTQGQGHTV